MFNGHHLRVLKSKRIFFNAPENINNQYLKHFSGFSEKLKKANLKWQNTGGKHLNLFKICFKAYLGFS